MTIDYKKCIHCGSRKVLGIVYGYPSSALAQAEKDGKVILGGCEVSAGAPHYHCKDCGHEWNKIQAIDYAYRKIKTICAYVGGHRGPNYDVEIDLVKHQFSWRGDKNGRKLPAKLQEPITQYSPEQLIDNIKTLNILNWDRKHMNYRALDGTQWSMIIERDGKTIKKYGSNAYPRTWGDFCKFVQSVTGKKFS